MKILLLFSEKYTTEILLSDLLLSEFSHEYKSFSDSDFEENALAYLSEADEVWIYGDVYNLATFKLCRSLGKIIWQMD